MLSAGVCREMISDHAIIGTLSREIEAELAQFGLSAEVCRKLAHALVARGWHPVGAPIEWRTVLSVGQRATIEKAKARFCKLAIKNHPDRGGDPVIFARLCEAMDAAKAELLPPAKNIVAEEIL